MITGTSYQSTLINYGEHLLLFRNSISYAIQYFYFYSIVQYSIQHHFVKLECQTRPPASSCKILINSVASSLRKLANGQTNRQTNKSKSKRPFGFCIGSMKMSRCKDLIIQFSMKIYNE